MRTAPDYISDCRQYKTQLWRTLQSSSQRLLATPTARLKTYRDRAFGVAAPKTVLASVLVFEIEVNT